MEKSTLAPDRKKFSEKLRNKSVLKGGASALAVSAMLFLASCDENNSSRGSEGLPGGETPTELGATMDQYSSDGIEFDPAKLDSEAKIAAAFEGGSEQLAKQVIEELLSDEKTRVREQPFAENESFAIVNYDDEYTPDAVLDPQSLKETGPRVAIVSTEAMGETGRLSYQEKPTLNFTVIYDDGGFSDPLAPKRLDIGLSIPDPEKFATPPPDTANTSPQETREVLEWVVSPGNLDAFEAAYVTIVPPSVNEEARTIGMQDGLVYNYGELADADTVAKNLNDAREHLDAAFSK